MAHLQKRIIVHAPLTEVAALAVDPHRWHIWFSGLTEPEKIEGDGGPGTVVKHGYLLAGIRFPVTTRVVKLDESPSAVRWEATIEGPLDGRHTWIYTPAAEGTQVEVDMEYSVPGDLLGKFADRLIIERMQSRAMEHTLDNLKYQFEAEPA